MRNPFPYPLTDIGIGEVDPLDYKYKDGTVVLEPGWWRHVKVPEKKKKRKKR